MSQLNSRWKSNIFKQCLKYVLKKGQIKVQFQNQHWQVEKIAFLCWRKISATSFQPALWCCVSERNFSGSNKLRFAPEFACLDAKIAPKKMEVLLWAQLRHLHGPQRNLTSFATWMFAFPVTLSLCHERHRPHTAAHSCTCTLLSEQCEDYRHVPLPPRAGLARAHAQSLAPLVWM